ncbi:hypothetical protein ACLB1O_15665 [Escherichia coli]
MLRHPIFSSPHHDASCIQVAAEAACMMMFKAQEINMLDTNMKTQLKAYLEKLTKPVELIATLDDSAKSAEIKELLAENRRTVRQSHL